MAIMADRRENDFFFAIECSSICLGKMSRITHLAFSCFFIWFWLCVLFCGYFFAGKTYILVCAYQFACVIIQRDRCCHWKLFSGNDFARAEPLLNHKMHSSASFRNTHANRARKKAQRDQKHQLSSNYDNKKSTYLRQLNHTVRCDALLLFYLSLPPRNPKLKRTLTHGGTPSQREKYVKPPDILMRLFLNDLSTHALLI